MMALPSYSERRATKLIKRRSLNILSSLFKPSIPLSTLRPRYPLTLFLF
jgi:hypothetical protein